MVIPAGSSSERPASSPGPTTASSAASLLREGAGAAAWRPASGYGDQECDGRGPASWPHTLTDAADGARRQGIDCRRHTVGGQGKSGEKPARSRHCDRAKKPQAKASHWGRHGVPGKVRWTTPEARRPVPGQPRRPSRKGWLKCQDSFVPAGAGVPAGSALCTCDRGGGRRGGGRCTGTRSSRAARGWCGRQGPH